MESFSRSLLCLLVLLPLTTGCEDKQPTTAEIVSAAISKAESDIAACEGEQGYDLMNCTVKVSTELAGIWRDNAVEIGKLNNTEREELTDRFQAVIYDIQRLNAANGVHEVYSHGRL